MQEVSARHVAEWMMSNLEERVWLYQEVAARRIAIEFGKDFVYRNENGNPAIDKKVLKEFRKISDGKVVWDRGAKAWRKVKETESYSQRQVD